MYCKLSYDALNWLLKDSVIQENEQRFYAQTRHRLKLENLFHYKKE